MNKYDKFVDKLAHFKMAIADATFESPKGLIIEPGDAKEKSIIVRYKGNSKTRIQVTQDDAEFLANSIIKIYSND